MNESAAPHGECAHGFRPGAGVDCAAVEYYVCCFSHAMTTALRSVSY
jgi:hypothetical protein